MVSVKTKGPKIDLIGNGYRMAESSAYFSLLSSFSFLSLLFKLIFFWNFFEFTILIKYKSFLFKMKWAFVHKIKKKVRMLHIQTKLYHRDRPPAWSISLSASVGVKISTLYNASLFINKLKFQNLIKSKQQSFLAELWR